MHAALRLPCRREQAEEPAKFQYIVVPTTRTTSTSVSTNDDHDSPSLQQKPRLLLKVLAGGRCCQRLSLEGIGWPAPVPSGSELVPAEFSSLKAPP